MSEKQLQFFAWGISVGSVLLAILAWGQDFRWQINDMTPYQWFPLLGLIAFSLMWAHYVASVVRQHNKIEPTVLKRYFDSTSVVVLIAILLHPGLLAYQLVEDGLGRPPDSFYDYVGQAMGLSITLGYVALGAFLLYEFRHWFGQRSWWRFISYASDVAILLIYLHALRLGSQLVSGWYLGVWYFYGATLLASLVYIHSRRLRKPKV
ncbi:MAG: hypothetical protein U5K77_02280 [Candidatus Saccharibacteria bacterium]|nr:hypothetical protein [Candidatus Saccharibacteria bacterium]